MPGKLVFDVNAFFTYLMYFQAHKIAHFWCNFVNNGCFFSEIFTNCYFFS